MPKKTTCPSVVAECDTWLSARNKKKDARKMTPSLETKLGRGSSKFAMEILSQPIEITATRQTTLKAFFSNKGNVNGERGENKPDDHRSTDWTGKQPWGEEISLSNSTESEELPHILSLKSQGLRSQSPVVHRDSPVGASESISRSIAARAETDNSEEWHRSAAEQRQQPVEGHCSNDENTEGHQLSLLNETAVKCIALEEAVRAPTHQPSSAPAMAASRNWVRAKCTGDHSQRQLIQNNLHTNHPHPGTSLANKNKLHLEMDQVSERESQSQSSDCYSVVVLSNSSRSDCVLVDWENNSEGPGHLKSVACPGDGLLGDGAKDPTDSGALMVPLLRKTSKRMNVADENTWNPRSDIPQLTGQVKISGGGRLAACHQMLHATGEKRQSDALSFRRSDHVLTELTLNTAGPATLEDDLLTGTCYKYGSETPGWSELGPLSVDQEKALSTSSCVRSPTSRRKRKKRAADVEQFGLDLDLLQMRNKRRKQAVNTQLSSDRTESMTFHSKDSELSCASGAVEGDLGHTFHVDYTNSRFSLSPSNMATCETEESQALTFHQ